MRRERKVDKWHLEVSLGGGLSFRWGYRPGAGGQRDEGRRRVWGLHTLFTLFAGKWILKKKPTTRHLCLCEGPW